MVTYRGVMYGAGKGQLGNNMKNWGYFKAFTVDSNVLSGLCSLIMLVILVKNLVKKTDILPKWAVVLQLVSASAVGLTFLVVLTFLAPMQVAAGHSYFTSFSGDMFFFHFLNPVLAGVMACRFADRYKITMKYKCLAMIPFVIYAIVYVYEAVITKHWMDFYGFTFGGKNQVVPFVVAIIAAAQFFIITVLSFFHNKKSQRGE